MVLQDVVTGCICLTLCIGSFPLPSVQAIGATSLGAPDRHHREITPPNSCSPRNTNLYPSIVPPHRERSLHSCSDCPFSYRRWFTDAIELRNAAYYCGFDYLQVRFTQSFTSDTLAGRLTVYAHSLPNDSLLVDSAVTVFTTPGSTNETLTIYHPAPHRPCFLSLPSTNTAPSPSGPDEKLDAFIRRANGFTARCRFREHDRHESWAFSIDGSTWLLEKGRLQYSDTAPPANRSFSGTIAYRLATWGSTPWLQSTFAAEHSIPPEFISLHINDSLTICRIQLECASRYGLHECLISCGSDSDTVRFSGENQRCADIILNAHPDDSLLTLVLSDIHGNTTLRKAPLFVGRRTRQYQWAHNRTIDLLSRQRAIQNPVTHVAYMLSKFSEEPQFSIKRKPDGTFQPEISINPVSTLFKTIFRRKSERYLATKKDVPIKNLSAPTITFPLQGTVQNNLFEKGTGRYTSYFFTDRCVYNGTRAALLVNPTLRRGNDLRQQCTFNLTAPLYTGKHPSSWSIAEMVNDIKEPPETMVLVCRKIIVSKEQILLHDLPCLFKHPSENASFSVFHASHNHLECDTLTVSWRICYTDRTAALFWRQYVLSSNSVTRTATDNGGTITASPCLVINGAGDRCLLLEVLAKGNKSIFRVDTFIHSKKERQIVGWGVASVPG